MIRNTSEHNETVKPNDFEMERLRAALPEYFDGDGNFMIDRLQQALQDGDVDFTREGYELKFLGKSYAKYLTSMKTETVVVPDLEHNSKPENKDSENLYIVGDNLDALKHLLGSYAGKVKCIYIDPPYNTGSDGFIYNDDFGFTPPNSLKRSGSPKMKPNAFLTSKENHLIQHGSPSCTHACNSQRNSSRTTALSSLASTTTS
ncbi:site-specific DNA-methyltransferase [Corynebacterium propinquum]|nr:site-specific DNA-methyltransferase [Corynebacterium propinquum]WKS42519.1 site-specific DNA-methyltransferase [Corynebacterium propinquum]WKS46815.1 site-specific DNA-methyltransferase [Corynebacterium propinquum]